MKWTEREVCSIFRGSEIEGRLWKEDRQDALERSKTLFQEDFK